MLEGYDDLLCTEEAAEALKIGKNEFLTQYKGSQICQHSCQQTP